MGIVGAGTIDTVPGAGGVGGETVDPLIGAAVMLLGAGLGVTGWAAPSVVLVAFGEVAGAAASAALGPLAGPSMPASTMPVTGPVSMPPSAVSGVGPGLDPSEEPALTQRMVALSLSGWQT